MNNSDSLTFTEQTHVEHKEKQSVLSYIAKAFMVVLILLLVLSFAISGIGTSLRGIGSDAIATVGAVDISEAQFRQFATYEMNKARGGLGFDIDKTMQQIIEARALELLIDRALMSQEISRLGLRVGQKHIVDEIRNNRIFQVGGRFDRDRYDLMLGQIGQTDKTYSSSLKRDLAADMMIQSLFEPSHAPEVLVKLLHRYEGEKRTVDTLVIPADYVKDIAEPSNEVLEAYFEENKESFVAPEYRTVSFLPLSPKDVESEIDLTDEALLAYYEQNIADYSSDEVRNLEQIFVNEEGEINAIAEDLDSGKNFYAVAKNRASQDKKAVQYGDVQRKNLAGIVDDEGLDSIFSLEIDAYTKPLQSVVGWHIFRLKAVAAPQEKAFSEVRTQIKQAVIESEAADILYQFIGNVEDELAGGATLEEAAKTFSLSVKEIKEISREGQRVGEQAGVSVPAYGEFLKTAFDTQEGLVSQAVVDDDGLHYYMLRVDGVVPSRLKVLDETRGKVLQAYKAFKRQELQIQKTKKLATELGDAAPSERVKLLAQNARKMGLEISPVKAVYRSSFNASVLPRALVDELYTQTEIGASSVSHQRADGAMVVGVVSEIKAAEANDAQFGLDKIREKVKKEAAQNLVSEFMNSLRVRFPVEYK